MTLPNGEKTVEVLPDNAQVTVIYRLQDYKQIKVAEAAPEFTGIHMIGWPILPPGQTISFSVPVKYFKQKSNVAVNFVYTWEGFNSQALIHQVYFLNDNLPGEAKEWR